MSGIKVVFLGEAGSGKTSAITSFRGVEFSPDYNSTIGADVDFLDNIINEKISIETWDVSGDPQYESDMSYIFEKTDICVYCVDLSKRLDKLDFSHFYKTDS